MQKYIGHDAGGYFVEWYREDEFFNGFTKRWYGSHLACIERAKGKAPAGRWREIGTGDAPPHDAATCTGMYDRD